MRPSPAAVVAALAIVVATTGSALAVRRDAVGSSQIRHGEVRSKEIAQLGVGRADMAADSVGTGKIADDSLTGADVDEESIPGVVLTDGPEGATGPVGPVGADGAIGHQGPDAGAGFGPAGPAGGDLAGSYPNPTFAMDSIAGPQILDGQVNGNDLAEAIRDGDPATPSRRSLGNGAGQAAAGNDPRLSDARPAADGSVTSTKVADGLLRLSDVAAFTALVPFPGPGIDPEVDPGACLELDEAAAAIDEGDLVLVQPPRGTPAGLVTQPYQAVDDQRLFTACNPTAAAITVPDGFVRFMVIRP